MYRGTKVILVTMMLFMIMGLNVEWGWNSKASSTCSHDFEIETLGIKNHTLKCTICGEKKVENHDENMMIWEDAGNGHKYKCKICGKVLDEQPHNFEDSWGFDDTYHWQKCKTCGAEKIEDKVKHVPGETWHETGNRHYKNCKDCDKQLLLEDHEDKNGDGICDVCELPIAGNEMNNTYCDKGCTTWHYTNGTAYDCYATCEGGHKIWVVGKHSGTPTCTKKQTCTICGKTYWLEHDYVDGVCTRCGGVQSSNPTPDSEPTQSPTPTTTPSPEPTESPAPTTTPSPEPTQSPTPTTTPSPEPTEVWYKDVYYHWQEGGEKELHKPIPATCTKPISCVCGAYVGKPKGHQYDSNGICTVCKLPKEQAEKNVPFDDVNPGSWYYENGSVKFVTDKGYIEGLSATEFGPDKPMTREKFIKMLYNVENRPTVSQSDILEVSNEFNDIYVQHDLKAIVWGRKNNIMNGLNNGEFGTDKSISRQQMAVALKRYAEYKGRDTSKRADLTKFDDSGDIFNWAEEAFSWAVASKIIQGDSNNRLNPQANATRAQVATMIMNYLANK